jgi:hypothetical protein
MPETVTFQDLSDELFKNNEKIRSIVDGQFKVRDEQIRALDGKVNQMNNAQTQMLVKQETILGSMQRVDENVQSLVNHLEDTAKKTSVNSNKINWLYAGGSAAWATLLFVGGIVWLVMNRIFDVVSSLHR